MTYTVLDLAAALDRVPTKSRQFATDLVAKSTKYALSDKQLYWVDKLTQEALNPTPPVERQTVAVGDLSGIIALFDRAKINLKFPAIVLSCPGADTMRVNVAGEKAKFPGSLNVASYEIFDEGRRRWYGRVHRDGRFEPSAKAEPSLSVMAARLREFAADPVRVASEHGQLTGRCCFCNLPLKDERSTAVGYGKICAKHYGLPWGVTSERIAA